MIPTSSSLTLVTSEVARRAKPDSVLSLFLDFDGTLVPIAADPSAPRLERRTRETLRRISGKQSCITTVISGRAIDDLHSRIRLDGIVYAGNHGLEIEGRDIHFVEPVAAALKERLDRLSKTLAMKLHPIDGALVEYKGLSTSVHYRQVEPRDVDRVKEAVIATVAQQGERFRLSQGKKVIDVVPRTEWHKGAAARWINRQINVEEPLSIYLGDDTTDEDAFSALTKAITVRVGESGATCARYRLHDYQAVEGFLEWMADFNPRTSLFDQGS